MDLGILSIITGITFLLVFLNLLFAFTKSQEKVNYWAGLVILLFIVVLMSG